MTEHPDLVRAETDLLIRPSDGFSIYLLTTESVVICAHVYFHPEAVKVHMFCRQVEVLIQLVSSSSVTEFRL